MSDIALFEENIRLAMKNMGLFMDFLVGAGKKEPWAMESQTEI